MYMRAYMDLTLHKQDLADEIIHVDLKSPIPLKQTQSGVFDLT